jgi:hypothetical protein
MLCLYTSHRHLSKWETEKDPKSHRQVNIKHIMHPCPFIVYSNWQTNEDET